MQHVALYHDILNKSHVASENHLAYAKRDMSKLRRQKMDMHKGGVNGCQTRRYLQDLTYPDASDQ